MQPLLAPIHHPMPVDLMQAEIRKICGLFNVEPTQRAATIRGHVALQRAGLIDAAIVAIDAGKIGRDTRAIRQDPGEHLFLLVQNTGHCRIEQNTQSTLLRPGDMFLVDSVHPSAFHYNFGASSQISFHIPRSDMIHRFGPACTGGAAISRGNPLWLPLRAIIKTLIRDTGAHSHLSLALISLLGAHLHATRGHNLTHTSETLLSRALALIDHHCANPNFGPTTLARQLNVPDRTLQRHFKPLQETPRQRLLSRRLALAHSRLKDATAGDTNNIAAIAYASGFNDLSHFYHGFRKKYGMTPGDALHNH